LANQTINSKSGKRWKASLLHPGSVYNKEHSSLQLEQKTATTEKGKTNT